MTWFSLFLPALILVILLEKTTGEAMLSGCLDLGGEGAEFRLDPDVLDRQIGTASADAGCVFNFPGSRLARIDSNISFEAALQFMNFVYDANGNVGADRETYIGLKTSDAQGDPTNFLFADGNNDNVDFFETPFQFPWAQDQPNDANGDENCVEIGANGLWNDISCSELRRALCRRSCRIISPTPSPVAIPEPGPSPQTGSQGPSAGVIVGALFAVLVLISVGIVIGRKLQ